MSPKTYMLVLGRLPLLLVVDSILRGTFLDFTIGSYGTSLQPFTSESDENFMLQILWNLSLFLLTVLSIILVCTPMSFILDFYRWITGAALIWLSYDCNKRYTRGLASLFKDSGTHNGTNVTENLMVHPSSMPYPVNLIIQLFISLAFDQMSITRILSSNRLFIINTNTRYPLDIVMYMSFSLPVFIESILIHSPIFGHSVSLSIVLPLLALSFHLCSVIHKVSHEVIMPIVMHFKTQIREIGVDGLIMSLVEKANMSWLLRLFFITRVICQIILSKTLQNTDYSLDAWSDIEVWKALLLEILYNMCGTLISVISLASIITIISGWSLSCVYKVIQAYDEEESLQPVVSGFLFVLLAMQTGITAITGDLRLQLLFQNSILLVVANQHFVHNVATELLLKASTDDTTLEKHIRPLLPFAFFFTFPFFAVVPLWSYSFRISWLLAVTVFCIELIIKSVSSIIIYSINMVHMYTNIFSEDIDNLLFYVRCVCGCLEFICGVFLFFNGAYIFIYESGGFIRLFMMTIHFYCNIYQSAIKGWSSYKLRLSAWEKVNKLEAAKQEQLDDNDICSICYQEMTEAVSLSCLHIFHKICLQKWLSIKETCPLCHEELKKADVGDS